VQKRGLFSGILQEGYALGFLIAGGVFFAMSHFYPEHTWRAMFVVGVLPALLIFFIRARVPESPVWLAQRHEPIAARTGRSVQGYALVLLVAGGIFYFTLSFAAAYTWYALGAAALIVIAGFAFFTKRDPEEKPQWPLFLYAVLLMAGFNFMSHGTQDLYPTFLTLQQGFSPAWVGTLTAIMNLGAIVGGIFFGRLSQRFGRRNMIVLCSVLGAALIPLWAFSQTILLLAAGGFLMQVMVQGAWGIIPAHLNEISPGGVRGTFPGFTYQIGNLISAGALQMEAAFAKNNFPLPSGHPDYAKAMAVVAIIVFAAVATFTAIGYFITPERRHAELATE